MMPSLYRSIYWNVLVPRVGFEPTTSRATKPSLYQTELPRRSAGGGDGPRTRYYRINNLVLVHMSFTAADLAGRVGIEPTRRRLEVSAGHQTRAVYS